MTHRTLFTTGDSTIEILVDNPLLTPSAALVIIPSYGRDAGRDYDAFTNSLVSSGYQVLRPQPLGTYLSTGPMDHMTLEVMSAQIANIIKALASQGQAFILGHAFGNFIARITAKFHPDVVRGVVLAAAQGESVPKAISITPFIAGNPSVTVGQRLAALMLGFFAPSHGELARTWLDGWYPATLSMQERAVNMPGGLKKEAFWDLGGRTNVLEIIPADDPFKTHEQWNQMRDLLGHLCTSVIVNEASHALFPEQSEEVAQRVIAWMGTWTQNITSSGSVVTE